MSEKWFLFRHWLASKIVGYSIDAEVEAAYEAGRQWGKVERSNGLPGD